MIAKSALFSVTTPRCISGRSRWCRCWRPYFVGESTQWASAGERKYLYRTVDREGDTVDFLLTAKRNLAAVRRFLERAIDLHDLQEKITIDRSGANTAAIESVNADACVNVELPQYKYLNNIV